MTELLRLFATRRLALSVALAVLLLAPAFAVHAAPSAQETGRIAVVVFPDLAGEVDGQSCPGCDGEYTDDDADANSDDPLPSLDVVLLDADGDEVERNATNGLANGRQVTFFSVPEQGAFTIVLENVPESWVPCPDHELTREIDESDFNETTGIATIDFYMWSECVDEATDALGVVDEPTDETDEPTDEPTDEADEPTDEPTDDAADESTDESTGALGVVDEPTDDTDEPTDETTDEVADEPTDEPVDEATDEPAAEPSEAVEAPSESTTTMGAIRGIVFDDKNQDGVLDPDEAGVADVEVILSGNGVNRSARSAGAGTFAFPDLTEGSYDVTVSVPEGTALSTPGEQLGVAVSGDVVMGIDFGLVAADAAVAPTSESAEASEPGTMPETGVQLQSRSSLLLGLAAAIGVLGAVGLALETRRGRRSRLTRKGQ